MTQDELEQLAEDWPRIRSDIADLKSEIRSLEREQGQLRRDIKDVLGYVELARIKSSSPVLPLSPEQASQYNDLVSRLNVRYGSPGLHF